VNPVVIQKLFYENRKTIEKEIKMRTNDLINSGRFCFSDADDISQELRIEVFNALAKYDSKQSKIASFIRGIVKKKGIDLLRRRKAKRRNFDEIISIDDIYTNIELGKVDNFPELFVYRDTKEKMLFDIETLASRLPNDYKKICNLLMSDYNVSEISEILDKNRRTIMKRIEEIRSLLKNI
jgi:sigma-70 region 2